MLIRSIQNPVNQVSTNIAKLGQVGSVKYNNTWWVFTDQIESQWWNECDTLIQICEAANFWSILNYASKWSDYVTSSNYHLDYLSNFPPPRSLSLLDLFLQVISYHRPNACNHKRVKCHQQPEDQELPQQQQQDLQAGHFQGPMQNILCCNWCINKYRWHYFYTWFKW